MQEVMVPWGLYVAAIAAGHLFLQNLPLALRMNRAGARSALDNRFWWVGAIALLALCAWPFFAAVKIEWPRYEPSFLTVVLMTFGALAIGWVISRVVDVLCASYAQSLSGLGPDNDVTAADLDMLKFLRRYRSSVLLATVALTIAAYWLIQESVQDCLGRGWC